MCGGDGEREDDHEDSHKTKRKADRKVTPSLVCFDYMACIREVTVAKAFLDLYKIIPVKKT